MLAELCIVEIASLHGELNLTIVIYIILLENTKSLGNYIEVLFIEVCGCKKCLKGVYNAKSYK